MAPKETPKLRLSFTKPAVDLLNAQKVRKNVKSAIKETAEIVTASTGQEKIDRKRARTPKPSTTGQKDDRESKTPEPTKTSHKAIGRKFKTPDPITSSQKPTRARSKTPSKAATVQEADHRKSETPKRIVKPAEKQELANFDSRKLSKQAHKLKLKKLGQFIADSIYDDWPKHEEGRHKGLPDCSDSWTTNEALYISPQQVDKQKRDLREFAHRIPTLKKLLGADFVLEETKKRGRKSITPVVQAPTE